MGSAVTHPDMVRIVRAHGLRAVPVDLDPRTLAPLPNALDGTDDNDSLNGTNLPDDMRGLKGQDTLKAAAELDVLSGGRGNDTLEGEADNDSLSGDLGNDTLLGGPGDDEYRFTNGWGRDRIADADQGMAGERLTFSLVTRPVKMDLISSASRPEAESGVNTLNFGAGTEINSIDGSSSGDDIKGDNGTDSINGIQATTRSEAVRALTT